MWDHDMIGFNFGWGIGWLFMVFFWALLIAGVIAMVRWLLGLGGHRETPREDQALQILRERYARGEIDEEEFARRLDTLHRH